MFRRGDAAEIKWGLLYGSSSATPARWRVRPVYVSGHVAGQTGTMPRRRGSCSGKRADRLVRARLHLTLFAL